MSFFFLDHGSANAGGNDEHLCTGAGGHRLEERRYAPFFRLMFPEVCAHFESPRQEEHHSTPAGMRARAFQRDRPIRWPPGAGDSHERLLRSRWVGEPAQRGLEY